MRSTRVSMALGLAAAALLWTHGVQAQEECSADGDCGDARRCELPVSVGGCKEPPCDDIAPVTGDVGWCVPAALGMACASDADCGPELQCATYGSGSCSSDEPECRTVTESRCEYPPPEPLLCDDADHCAPPFACDTEQDEHACYYPDQTCTSDSDCAASFECVDGATLVAASDCQECDKDEGGGEPVCRSVPCEPAPDQCSPKLIACDADSDCPSEWLCREIGYDFKAWQWSDDVIGTHACVPGGTVQVSEGNYYLGGGFVALDVAGNAADGQAASSTGASKGGASDDVAAESARDHSASDQPAASGDDAAMMSDSSGCAVALPGHDSARGLGWLALGLVGLLLRRRRRG